MKWQDNGFLLSINKYNENSSIAEFFTLSHGKASGIIFGSTSKKIKSYLVIGNNLYLNYSSRNDTAIGNFKVEIESPNTAFFLDDKIKLNCIIYSMQIIKIICVENQKNEKIFYLINSLFEILKHDDWVRRYIFWELDLLKLQGYEINFKTYVEKIEKDGSLSFYSKTDKKKKIPNFLVDTNADCNRSELSLAFNIIGDFINKSILNDNSLLIPNSRIELSKQLNNL